MGWLTRLASSMVVTITGLTLAAFAFMLGGILLFLQTS
jgi:hypothetical protein